VIQYSVGGIDKITNPERKDISVPLYISIIITILFVLSSLSTGLAVEKPRAVSASKTGERQAIPEDPLGRSTPLGTIAGFTKAVQNKEYERAADYLDIKLSPRRAHELSRQLQIVLDRGLGRNKTMVSNKSEGDLQDNLPSGKERIGTVKVASGSFDIMLERIQKGNDPPIWLFSSETLKWVPEIYDEIDTFPIERYMPKSFIEKSFLWFPLWRWIVIILIIPLSFIVAALITRALVPAGNWLIHRFAKGHHAHQVKRITGPIRFLVLALAFYGLSSLSTSLMESLFWRYTASTLTVIGLTWLCIRLIDVAAEVNAYRLNEPYSGKVAVGRLIRQLSKGAALITGLIIIFYIAGINLTAVLTGIGVGGIAVAFAAQKTLENLFGGIMIVSDKTIRVGDFCKAGGYSGTVEDIGLRSTRIRSLDRTVISIPNGQLATMSLENVTLRDKFWFHHIINLRLETTSEQCSQTLTGIRKLLSEHAMVEPQTINVRFTGFGNALLNLDISAYILVDAYDIFQSIQEELLLCIMEIVEKSGAGLASPLQGVYITKNGKADRPGNRTTSSKTQTKQGQDKLPFT